MAYESDRNKAIAEFFTSLTDILKELKPLIQQAVLEYKQEKSLRPTGHR